MRKHYIDNIRWITVILVVIYHVIYMYNSVAVSGVIGPFCEVQYQDIIQYILYPWFMMILFVVSGISARCRLEGHSVREFLIDRTQKLLVPSTIGLFAFQWIQGYFSMQISHAFEYMPDTLPTFFLYLIMSVSGTGVLWYIQVLWIFSVVLVLIRKFEKGKLYAVCEKTTPIFLVLLGIPVWISAQILNTPVITVYRFGVYGFCFLLGYFLFAHEQVIERLSEHWKFLLGTAIVLGIGYVYHYFGENYAVEPVVNSPFSIAYAWFVILAVFAVMKRFGDRTSPFSEWMKAKGFGLYVFHYLPLSMAAYWMDSYMDISGEMPVGIIYFIAATAAFAGGFLLNEIISRIPVLRWCVLGIKKKEKKDVS